MNIEIFGNGNATITISNKRKFSEFNQEKDIAMLSELLMWHLSDETVGKILLYISKKVTDKMIVNKMNDIVKSGKPAVLISYPSGDKMVNSQDELIEMIKDELDGEDDHYDDQEEFDEDEYDGYEE